MDGKALPLEQVRDKRRDLAFVVAYEDVRPVSHGAMVARLRHANGYRGGV